MASNKRNKKMRCNICESPLSPKEQAKGTEMCMRCKEDEPTYLVYHESGQIKVKVWNKYRKWLRVGCDYCGTTEVEIIYIRQYWKNGFDRTVTRIFCSAACAKEFEAKLKE